MKALSDFVKIRIDDEVVFFKSEDEINYYFEGYKKALRWYAWWKNGRQYVGQQKPDGTGERDLKDLIALAEVKRVESLNKFKNL